MVFPTARRPGRPFALAEALSDSQSRKLGDDEDHLEEAPPVETGLGHPLHDPVHGPEGLTEAGICRHRRDACREPIDLLAECLEVVLAGLWRSRVQIEVVGANPPLPLRGVFLHVPTDPLKGSQRVVTKAIKPGVLRRPHINPRLLIAGQRPSTERTLILTGFNGRVVPDRPHPAVIYIVFWDGEDLYRDDFSPAQLNC